MNPAVGHKANTIQSSEREISRLRRYASVKATAPLTTHGEG